MFCGNLYYIERDFETHFKSFNFLYNKCRNNGANEMRIGLSNQV